MPCLLSQCMHTGTFCCLWFIENLYIHKNHKNIRLISQKTANKHQTHYILYSNINLCKVYFNNRLTISILVHLLHVRKLVCSSIACASTHACTHAHTRVRAHTHTVTRVNRKSKKSRYGLPGTEEKGDVISGRTMQNKKKVF